MLVGAMNGGITVGQVEQDHGDTISALILQLAAAVTKDTGLALEDGIVERSCAYTRSVAHFPTALKEFSWRNYYFYDISKRADQDPCPLHTEMLESGKEKGVLSWEVPN